MSLEKSIEILDLNYKILEGSFIYYLHEKSIFDEKAFEDIYNSIRILANSTLGQERERDITMKIFICHGRILKEFMYHLDANDQSVLENFPDDYNEYIEKLEREIHKFIFINS